MRDIKFRAWDNINKRYYRAVLIDSYLDVEQYTGLKDKNGVEIYEGDIVCQQMRFDETNGVIFWQEEKSRFAINLDGFITTITKPQEDSYEVVGNIHENPELLEVDR